MHIMIDSSIWIDFWRGGNRSHFLFDLLDENLVATNDIILSELIPYLILKKQKKVVELLREIKSFPIETDWDQIISIQSQCLKKGFNGIGIPDLLIAQNCLQNNLSLWTLDSHFSQLAKVSKLILAY